MVVEKRRLTTSFLGFTKLFWANRGNNHEITRAEDHAGFTFEEPAGCGVGGAPCGRGLRLLHRQALFQEIEELKQSFLRAEFEPMTDGWPRGPRGGLDVISSHLQQFLIPASGRLIGERQ